MFLSIPIQMMNFQKLHKITYPVIFPIRGNQCMPGIYSTKVYWFGSALVNLFLDMCFSQIQNLGPKLNETCGRCANFGDALQNLRSLGAKNSPFSPKKRPQALS